MMPYAELETIEATQIPVGKLLYIIGKGYVSYVNHHIQNLGINATQLHLLFEIADHSDINQEKIAERCNINKGAVARSIRKLEDMGLVMRQVDENNRRQNKVSLTSKGEETLEKSLDVLHQWEEEVILDEGYVDRQLLQTILRDIAVKTMELNKRGDE